MEAREGRTTTLAPTTGASEVKQKTTEDSIG